MKNRARFVLSMVAVGALLVGCGGWQLPAGMTSTASQGTAYIRSAWQLRDHVRPICPQVVGKPSCLALQVLKNGVPLSCSGPSGCGWTATQLESAYGLSGSLRKGSGTNVAVIEYGDLSDAATSLATYRSAYGLGAAKLKKYNEYGQQYNYPPSCETYYWCYETYLDIDMVSAACPRCNIFLMEAKGTIKDLEMTEAAAVTVGATILSNSWSCNGSWDCFDTNFPNYFDTKGIAYLAASGDFYDQVGGPSALSTVIAVGGTQLASSGSKYTETLWDRAVGGCSDPSEVGDPGVPKPAWQHDPDCSYRTVTDVSAEAGCAPGVAVYEGLYSGWTTLCGTSVATPFTAGIIGLAGNATKLNAGQTFWSFNTREHKNYFHHPTGSINSCGNYLCGGGRYKKDYSGPGGWGTPDGIKGY